MEYSCSVDDLSSKKMFFYDMYIIDEVNDCLNLGEAYECLYPVPVLNRNLVEDGSFPNMNMERRDELDDKMVRRFFLFDNEVSTMIKKDEAPSLDLDLMPCENLSKVW